MNIELPKDAEGREIPLDTEVLFDKDGKELCVKRIEFDPFSKEWNLVVKEGSSSRFAFCYRPCVVYLEKPDSWEKLEDDLNRVVENNDAFYEASCAYMNQSGAVCNGCRLHGRHTRNCTEEMFKDVVSRIRKLKGED